MTSTLAHDVAQGVAFRLRVTEWTPAEQARLDRVRQAITDAAQAGRFQVTVGVPLGDAPSAPVTWDAGKQAAGRFLVMLVARLRTDGFGVRVPFWPTDYLPNFWPSEVSIEVTW